MQKQGNYLHLNINICASEHTHMKINASPQGLALNYFGQPYSSKNPNNWREAVGVEKNSDLTLMLPDILFTKTISKYWVLHCKSKDCDLNVTWGTTSLHRLMNVHVWVQLLLRAMSLQLYWDHYWTQPAGGDRAPPFDLPCSDVRHHMIFCYVTIKTDCWT